MHVLKQIFLEKGLTTRAPPRVTIQFLVIFILNWTAWDAIKLQLTMTKFQLCELKYRVIWFLKLLMVMQFSRYAAAQTMMAPPPPPPSDPFAFNPNFNPSMAIMMVIVVSAIFILGFLAIYIRRRNEGSRNINGGAGWLNASTRNRPTEARGIDAKVIETFPTFVYSYVKELKAGNGLLECAVCLNEFEDDETLRLIPKCSHAFHPHCIDAWLSRHATCPVCRANLCEISFDKGNFHNLDVDEPNRRNYDDEPQGPQGQVSICIIEGINASGQTTTTNSDCSPRSWSTGLGSGATDHLPVQPGEDHQRFTLKLPEDFKNRLMNLNRTKSCMDFPRAESSRMSYRSESLGRGQDRKKFYHYDRFDRESGSDR